MLGNFMSTLPNTLALNTAKALIQCGVERGYIKSAYTLKGHRDGSATECPGSFIDLLSL
jgi:N-acetylmuramoyl-L-alanine amidase